MNYRWLLSILCFITTGQLLAQTPFSVQIASHRADYKAEFLKTPNSPLKTEEALSYLRFYEPDSSFRVEATLRLTRDAEPFDMPTYNGQKQTYVKYAVASFTLGGKLYELSLYRSLRLVQLPQYRDYLFLPFKDATAGQETYGGGRYLDIRTGAIKDGRLVIDFNKAYNPYCAYSDGYSCPIPPKENHLPVAIRAGEKTYGKEH